MSRELRSVPGVALPALALCALAASFACEATSTASNSPSGAETAPSEGYALLHGLLAKERHASKILWVKLESDPMEAFLEEVSRAAASAADELAAWAENDSRIDLESDGLPAVETETREAIESTTASELLEASDDRFEVAMLLSQLKALRYGSHLARVLEKHEAHPGRKSFLDSLSKRLEGLRERGLELLWTRLPAPASS